MRMRLALAAAAVVALSACAQRDLGEYRNDLEPFAEAATTGGSANCDGSTKALAFATPQVKVALPTRVEETEVAQALTDLLRSAGTASILEDNSENGANRSWNVSASEMKNFSDAVLETFTNPSIYVAPSRFYSDSKAYLKTDGGTPPLIDVFKFYYTQYIDGKFVSRFGTSLSKLNVDEGVSNETISAAIAVFIEALADYALRTPLLVDDEDSYFLSDGKEPTVAAYDAGNDFKLVEKIEIVEDELDDKCSISEREAKAIKYLANLAADKSQGLAGLTVESFGDLEFAFIIGGNFSFGDNETLAEIFKSVFKNVSRRGTERVALEVFSRLDTSEVGAALKENDTSPRAEVIRFAQSF